MKVLKLREITAYKNVTKYKSTVYKYRLKMWRNIGVSNKVSFDQNIIKALIFNPQKWEENWESHQEYYALSHSPCVTNFVHEKKK